MRQPIPVRVEHAPDCRVVHMSGVVGQLNLNEGTLMVYTETPVLVLPMLAEFERTMSAARLASSSK